MTRKIIAPRLCPILLAAALIPIGIVAAEATATARGYVRAERDGVTLEAYAIHDKVMFCISAEKHLKISSEYGVQFTINKIDLNLWSEPLSKTVTSSGWYFDLPLQIALKTRGGLRERRVHVDLGACSDSNCTPIVFEITVPPYYSADRTCGAPVGERNK